MKSHYEPAPLPIDLNYDCTNLWNFETKALKSITSITFYLIVPLSPYATQCTACFTCIKISYVELKMKIDPNSPLYLVRALAGNANKLISPVLFVIKIRLVPG